jgi:Ketopantoate reductase PanE/ApbA
VQPASDHWLHVDAGFGQADIAFVCTKSYDTYWAALLIRQYLAPGGYVVSLQNCMNEATIAGVVGWGKTMGCIASNISVSLVEPGHVHRGGVKGGAAHTVYRTGEVHDTITDRAHEICRLVSNADSAKVTDNLWGERWSKLVANTMATHSCPRRQVTLDAIATRPGLIAEPKPHTPRRRACAPDDRRIGNPTVFPGLAADAALGYRHDDPVLVNIKPDIRDTIPHDPSPMHEARRRPIRRNPCYLHTVRPVARSSGGHVV